jgi:arsenate reductase (thioredoxin)
MAERGIDIAREYPKPWTDEIVQAADVVITMGCGDACPIFPGRRYEEWVLEDPAGQSVEAIRPIRDEIERRVHQLLAELEVPATAPVAAITESCLASTQASRPSSSSPSAHRAHIYRRR